ncbi:protein of unknown function [Gracilibacillus ureilyticus]|uniref:DUF4288 domain-containing protein n=1 Tax=Gracilibacillus ureilyticus TaxID=531814 RepID=A0A1H9QM61_9BACI|nr:DUF4288 domain-containing protein [Gracilibacillus ureilyticus]SER61544.1 protein of unknown function [Gracilibacillus ureilyticus]
MKIYSVKVLFESTVVPNIHSSKTFEERIILIKARKRGEIEPKIRSQFVDDTYKNAEGGKTTWTLVRILDIFETVDTFEGDINFKEVYSRFLPFDKHIAANEVIELYSLDK